VVEGIQNPYNYVFEKLNKLSITDDLTDLFNHKYFLDSLEKLKEHSEQSNKPFYLVMCDIDNFKNVNDTYGHTVGDKVLVEIAGLLRSSIRYSDFAFRYSGEEFAMILYDVDYGTAYSIVQRINVKLATTRFTEEKINITMSITVVKYSGESAEELIRKAEQLLRNAKSQGYNKTLFTTD
jgi:diguanylate cyclase (GGDEF)-like protein